MANQFVFRIMLVSWLIKAASAQSAPSLAKPNCQQKCGNIIIPYPFGIGPNCSADEYFLITCNTSSTRPKPFINAINMEILNISLSGTIRVRSPVMRSNCPNLTDSSQAVDLRRSPHYYSDAANQYVATGCDNLALVTDSYGTTVGGCMSVCNSTSRDGSCYGINCCQMKIPSYVTYFNTSLRGTGVQAGQKACKNAFIVDQHWFNNLTSPYDVEQELMENVPAVLNWRTYQKCKSFEMNGSSITNGSVSLCGTNAFCLNQSLCSCNQGYDGNPYLPDGCQDVNECANGSDRCEQICVNTPGSYNCYCFPGYTSFPFYSSGTRNNTSVQYDNASVQYYCYKQIQPNANSNRARMAIMGTSIGLGIVLLLFVTWWLYKIMKRRKKTMLKEKFFKRNGGLLLQQQLSSGEEGNVEKTKLFTSKELEKATDHYNESRILGQGGQGTVYKGMLTDGRIVAVKKSKIEDETKIEHFINEVVILSTVNHRNVVKLHGCCLETEVPMLVYEFIPNGTLFHYIHYQNEDFPLSWETRMRIATETAGALSYLHSAASVPIYHRDIKSTNILLDDKYKAKVADFGTSRSIAVGQTHLTTQVHGTFGYLDPEYFQSSQFTDKSDVYSFGVVLAELLTGQKPILSSIKSEEGRSLATHFILRMKENRLFDILDARVVKEGGKEEIMRVANLTKRCMHLNGRKRPTMKEVAMELEGIRMSTGATTTQQQYEEVEYLTSEITGPWDNATTSTGSFANNSLSSSLDVQPFSFN